MTIAAIRYKNIDKPYEVGFANFSAVTSDDILNVPDNSANAITPDLAKFIDNAVQVPKVETTLSLDSTIRAAKDALGAIRDVSKLSTKDIDKLTSNLLSGSPAAQSLFSKLGPKCSTKGLSSGKIGKPYDANVDCNGKKRKGTKTGCTSSEYSNVLNKLTNGNYQATAKDLNSALQNLIALSKYGYDVNLCGVFTELSGGLGKNLLSRASGALLGHVGLSGNALGLFDLAGASAGLHSILENPGGITSALSNFKLPKEVLGKDVSGLADRLTGSMTLLKDNWSKSSFDNNLSTSICGKFNPAVDTVLNSKQLGNSFSASSLNIPMVSDETYIATAYSMGSNSLSSSSIGSFSGSSLFA